MRSFTSDFSNNIKLLQLIESEKRKREAKNVIEQRLIEAEVMLKERSVVNAVSSHRTKTIWINNLFFLIFIFLRNESCRWTGDIDFWLKINLHECEIIKRRADAYSHYNICHQFIANGHALIEDFFINYNFDVITNLILNGPNFAEVCACILFCCTCKQI